MPEFENTEEEEIMPDDAQQSGDSAEKLLARLRFFHPEKDFAGVQDVQIKPRRQFDD